MFLWPAHRCLMMQTTMALVFLGTVVGPGWAGEKQNVMREKERTARIHELQRERAKSRVSYTGSNRSRKGRRGRPFHGLNSLTNRREA